MSRFYWHPARCSVCGGKGLADTSAHGATFQHADPKICEENLNSISEVEMLKAALRNQERMAERAARLFPRSL